MSERSPAIRNGTAPSGAAPPESSRPLTPPQILGVYCALQAAGCLLLLVAYAVLVVLRPIFFPEETPFFGHWVATFVLVPITYVPALVAWHAWALRRFGRHPRFYRLCAELAFALEVIGCVLAQRIA